MPVLGPRAVSHSDHIWVHFQEDAPNTLVIARGDEAVRGCVAAVVGDELAHRAGLEPLADDVGGGRGFLDELDAADVLTGVCDVGEAAHAKVVKDAALSQSIKTKMSKNFQKLDVKSVCKWKICRESPHL